MKEYYEGCDGEMYHYNSDEAQFGVHDAERCYHCCYIDDCLEEECDNYCPMKE